MMYKRIFPDTDNFRGTYYHSPFVAGLMILYELITSTDICNLGNLSYVYDVESVNDVYVKEIETDDIIRLKCYKDYTHRRYNGKQTLITYYTIAKLKITEEEMISLQSGNYTLQLNSTNPRLLNTDNIKSKIINNPTRSEEHTVDDESIVQNHFARDDLEMVTLMYLTHYLSKIASIENMHNCIESDPNTLWKTENDHLSIITLENMHNCIESDPDTLWKAENDHLSIITLEDGSRYECRYISEGVYLNKEITTNEFPESNFYQSCIQVQKL
jgi:hypothetical protein